MPDTSLKGISPMSLPGSQTKTGFVLGADQGQPFWFLNCLAINKVNSDDSDGLLTIADHRMPAGFAPPPHIHQGSDEALLVLDGELAGFCGEQEWRAAAGSLVYMPHGVPHGFTVSETGPGRILVIVSPGGFDQFVAAAGEPACDLRLPEPVMPDPVLITQLAAAHGIQILPPRQS